MSRAPVRKDFLKAHKREAADKRGSSNNEPPAEVSEINLLALSWKRRLGKWKAPDTSKPFKLGSDCAGYGSELIALRLLGLQKRCYLAMFCETTQTRSPCIARPCVSVGSMPQTVIITMTCSPGTTESRLGWTYTWLGFRAQLSLALVSEEELQTGGA